MAALPHTGRAGFTPPFLPSLPPGLKALQRRRAAAARPLGWGLLHRSAQYIGGESRAIKCLKPFLLRSPVDETLPRVGSNPPTDFLRHRRFQRECGLQPFSNTSGGMPARSEFVWAWLVGNENVLEIRTRLWPTLNIQPLHSSRRELRVRWRHPVGIHMKTIHVTSGPEPWLGVVAVLSGVGLLWLALRLVIRFGIRHRVASSCNWKRAAQKDGDVLRAWSCQTCTEIAFSATGKQPAQCRRGLSARPL